MAELSKSIQGHRHRASRGLHPEQRPQALEVPHRRPQVTRSQKVLRPILLRKYQSLWNQVTMKSSILERRKKVEIEKVGG